MTRATMRIIALQAVTAGAVTLSGALLAFPSHQSIVPLALALPALPAETPAMPANTAALTDSIVNSNIFSLQRQAPEERTFSAAPADSVVGDAPPASYAADAEMGDTLSQVRTDRVPALFGIIDGPAGRAALLRLDAAATGARLFHAGEGTAGLTVRSIGADRVVLNSASGPVVVTLPTRDIVP